MEVSVFAGDIPRVHLRFYFRGPVPLRAFMLAFIATDPLSSFLTYRYTWYLVSRSIKEKNGHGAYS